MPERARRYFVPWTVTALTFGFVMQFAFYFSCDTPEIASIYSAFAQNAAMPALFLGMLFERDDTRGQSMTIAVCKCVGTLTPTIYGQLGGTNIYILLTGAVCFALDIAYIVALRARLREDGR